MEDEREGDEVGVKAKGSVFVFLVSLVDLQILVLIHFCYNILSPSMKLPFLRNPDPFPSNINKNKERDFKFETHSLE